VKAAEREKQMAVRTTAEKRERMERRTKERLKKK
jgi:hypothetical protein